MLSLIWKSQKVYKLGEEEFLRHQRLNAFFTANPTQDESESTWENLKKTVNAKYLKIVLSSPEL